MCWTIYFQYVLNCYFQYFLNCYFQYVLNHSDHQAVLQLSNLVAGRYIFTLEVKDAEGLSSTDTAQLIVQPGRYIESILSTVFVTYTGKPQILSTLFSMRSQEKVNFVKNILIVIWENSHFLRKL